MLVPRPATTRRGPELRGGGSDWSIARARSSIQALETIKIAMDIGETLSGRMLIIDALTMSSAKSKFGATPDCKLCGDEPEVTELIDYEIFCGIAPPQAVA